MAEIPVELGQGKVRMETQRGCPYRCTFCAHRDLQRNKVYKHTRERALEEFALFNAKRVRKINVVDPVFNAGKDYLWILQKLLEMRPDFAIALQTRFENIRGDQGAKFLELCGALNVCLEFGLQSVIHEECAAINRRNETGHIRSVLSLLNDNGIKYEVSLIYGLPRQTVRSFEESVEFLRRDGCKVIKAFPLMLLKGTELCAQKELWGFREEAIGPYHIPLVVSSSSFDEHEWGEMKALADSLGHVERY